MRGVNGNSAVIGVQYLKHTGEQHGDSHHKSLSCASSLPLLEIIFT
jgi:hypothetical protein